MPDPAPRSPTKLDSVSGHPASHRRSAAAEHAVLLERLAAEIVRLHKQYWGRGLESAKAHMVDDLLFVVMRGGETTSERTLLDLGEHDSVRATRQTFQNLMAEQFVGGVENILGSKVRTYQSQILFDPIVVIEIFALGDPL